jgi:hypothetical protein
MQRVKEARSHSTTPADGALVVNITRDANAESSAPSVSADGTRVAFATRHVVAVLGGAPQPEASAPSIRANLAHHSRRLVACYPPNDRVWSDPWLQTAGTSRASGFLLPPRNSGKPRAQPSPQKLEGGPNGQLIRGQARATIDDPPRLTRVQHFPNLPGQCLGGERLLNECDAGLQRPVTDHRVGRVPRHADDLHLGAKSTETPGQLGSARLRHDDIAEQYIDRAGVLVARATPKRTPREPIRASTTP